MSTSRPVEVLLLSGIYDFPTDRICATLEADGVPYLRLNREMLASTSLQLDPCRGVLEVGIAGDVWRVDETLRAVWWRQPTFQRNTPGTPLSLEAQLERSQWDAFVRGLMLFDQARWINHPAATYQAESKPWQLRKAQRLGFSTPTTAITNDPLAPVGDLIGEKVALKSIDTVLLRDTEHQYFGYTRLVDWRDCADGELPKAPVVAQQVLDPKLDLRITVLGDKLWPVAIRSGGDGISGDWRLLKKQDLAFEDYALPSEVAARCIELIRGMGLTFGGIDLAVHRGEHMFIEINPTGEWGWLDSASRPIAQAIAEELVK